MTTPYHDRDEAILSILIYRCLEGAPTQTKVLIGGKEPDFHQWDQPGFFHRWVSLQKVENQGLKLLVSQFQSSNGCYI